MEKPGPTIVEVTYPEQGPRGAFHLPPSKSLLNRQLILAAVCGQSPPALPPTLPDDVRILAEQLRRPGPEWQTGEGGTTYRFLLAWLALNGQHGSLHAIGGMQRRPIGALVEALRDLGANLAFIEEEGCPPVRLEGFEPTGVQALSIDVSQSSQFASALLLSLPLVVDRVKVHLQGKPASRPYLDMTLRLLADGGASVRWEDDVIHLAQLRGLRPAPFGLEADWTAASYPYAMVALGPVGADMFLPGLISSGLQGDEALREMMTDFGVETRVEPEGIRIIKSEDRQPTIFAFDFHDHPDLAQTFVVMCAVMGVTGRFAGLHTLHIKETDRLAALRSELIKCRVDFSPLDGAEEEVWTLRGQAAPPGAPLDTYGDHRMAMALSLISRAGYLGIIGPKVVSKSFPGYWEEMEQVGFRLRIGSLT